MGVGGGPPWPGLLLTGLLLLTVQLSPHLPCVSASTTESPGYLTSESSLNTTNTTAPAVVPVADDVIPKAFIAFAILAGAVIIGAILAKIVDVIHDRKSLNDDASDMSDYTRVLLKKRLAVMAFGKHKGGEEEDGGQLQAQTVALKLGKKWSLKASQRRLKAVLDRSDVENGVVAEEGGKEAGTGAELVSYTSTSGLGPAVANVLSTSCQVAVTTTEGAGKGGPSLLSPSTLPSLQRVPSLTVDELEDEVFYEDAVMEALYKDPPATSTTASKAMVSEITKTNAPATLGVGVAGEMDRTKTSTPQPPSHIGNDKTPIPKPAASPIHSKADAWLFSDTPATPIGPTDPPHKDTAPGSPAKEGKGSLTTVRHDERPGSPLGEEEEARPPNPVPPLSGATSPILSGRTTPASVVAVVAAAEADAAVKADAENPVDAGQTDNTKDTTEEGLNARGTETPKNKSRTVDNNGARPKTASKSASTPKTSMRKIFQKPGSPGKRPQTGKKPTAAGASSSVPKRPKTAGPTAGPTRTGNRPASSKPATRGLATGRNKSAKR